jgi:prevent-host-death family protein
MPIVTVHKAKTTLSELLKRAEAGEEIIIARGSVPVARLVPLHAAAPKRHFGAMRGEIVVPSSFFDPLPADELAGWE